jgi:methyl-accepting chemotaxis protein
VGRRFRDTSIGVKLCCGFGSVLALFAVLGLVLLSQLGDVYSGGSYLGNRVLPGVERIQRIALYATDLRRAQLKYVLEAPGPQKTQALADWNTDTVKVETLLGTRGVMLGAADRRLRRSASARWTALTAQTARLQTLSKAAANPAGTALIDATTPTFRALIGTLGIWAGVDNQLALARLNANRSAYTNARVVGFARLGLLTVLGLLIAFAIAHSIKRRVDTVLGRIHSLERNCMTFLRNGLEALARGDLTQTYTAVTAPIDNPAGDEIGQIADALNTLRSGAVTALEAYNETAARLRQTIGQVARTADSVGSSSQQMATTSEEAGKANGEISHAVSDIAEGAERQVHMIEEARRRADEVGRAVAESAENIEVTARAAHEARDAARHGGQAAEQADDTMQSVRESSVAVTAAIRGLAAKSAQIDAIVEAITTIAEQTNLLALNAAIEAARAGDQGRGFAVVAEQVRKLAEESADQAEGISTLITAIQDETARVVGVVEDGARRTEQGAVVVEKARAAFLRIDASVSDMTARIEQVAAVSEQIASSADAMQRSIAEAAAVAEQSSASTHQVSGASQETSASTEQIAVSAHELSDDAEELTRLVAQFKVAA